MQPQKKLSEVQKLKYWLDTEFTILHIMFAVVLLFLTEGWIWNTVIGIYILWSVLYLFTRLAIIAADDPDYLRAPKR